MRMLSLLSLVIAGTLVMTSCQQATTLPTAEEGSAGVAEGKMGPKQGEVARQALVEWFECEECEEGQLKAVVELGEAVVSSLGATLVDGVSPATRELLRRELERRYDDLQRYAETHPKNKVASTKEEFVKLYLEKLDAQYRVRAAQALGAIGGSRARRALGEGLEKAKHPAVRDAIKKAMKDEGLP